MVGSGLSNIACVGDHGKLLRDSCVDVTGRIHKVAFAAR